MPTISDTTEYARSGVLLSYGVQDGSLLRAAAEYVDKLLRGVKPADLPLQQPAKFELVVNLGPAKAFGLTALPRNEMNSFRRMRALPLRGSRLWHGELSSLVVDRQGL